MDWSKVVIKLSQRSEINILRLSWSNFRASIPWIEAGVSASLRNSWIDANLGFEEVQAARRALCRSGVSPTAHIDEENPPDRTLGSGHANQHCQKDLELWFQSSSLEHSCLNSLNSRLQATWNLQHPVPRPMLAPQEWMMAQVLQLFPSAKCCHYHNSIFTISLVFYLKCVSSVSLSYTVSLVDVSISLNIFMLFDEWAFSCVRKCKSRETQPTSNSNAQTCQSRLSQHSDTVDDHIT